jgi:digeranylgeranylglycerophospholipid reductase
VVGAGPAGLIAGEYAARTGAKVLVLDRKREIGNPVRCAEGLGAMNFELINLKPSSDFVMNTVNKAVIFSPSGKKLEIEIPYKRFFLHILDRAGFERALAARYKSQGGELLLGTNVLDLVKKEGKIKGLKTTKGDVSGKVIIGADGVESRVGRWCGLSTRLKLNQIFSTAQHMLVDHDCEGNGIEIYFGEKFAPGGYAWMFPKGKGEANFGLGVLASHKKRPIELLTKFKEEKAKQARSTRLVTGCIPSTKPLSKTVKDNVMLVGDAARQTNPVSGGGIANAMVAGKLAGDIAGKVVMENQPISHLEEYERAWRKELEKTLLKKFKQRRILETDKGMERMFKLMKFAAFLRPIIPKSLLVKWLRPDF